MVVAIGGFGSLFQLPVGLFEEFLRLRRVALHIPLVGLLCGCDLVVGLIGEPLGRREVGVPFRIHIPHWWALGDHHAACHNPDSGQAGKDGSAKIHNLLPPRKQYRDSCHIRNQILNKYCKNVTWRLAAFTIVRWRAAVRAVRARLAAMTIPTEPIGSIPRPPELLRAVREHIAGRISFRRLDQAYDAAIRDTIERFEATGSPVITDGEQRKSSFATYPLEGLKSLAGNGVVIPFKDGHMRQLPRLTQGPFHYGKYAGEYVERAKPFAKRPLKQAVISASALSLIYPASGIEWYPRQRFIDDLVDEAAADITSALSAGAEVVQIDFTEGRLSLKLDPSGGLLKSFVELNNRVLDRFSPVERARIGVHVCPGGDHDSTHSADVDYAGLLPALFDTHAGRFYLQLSSEADRPRVLKQIAGLLGPGQLVFVGVTDPISKRIETPQDVCERVLEAAKFLPLNRLGTTDDCGFSPFADDDSTARDVAFAKIQARVEGTALAAALLGI